MAIHIECHTSLDGITATLWRALATMRSPFQEYEWFASAPMPGALRLWVAYREGEPVALLPLFLTERPTHYYHSPQDVLCGFRERGLLAAAKLPTDPLDRAAALDWFPAAITVSPFGYRGGMISASHDQEIAQALAEAADVGCRDEGVRIAAHYYLNVEDDAVWLAALRAQGARTVIVGADCNLQLHWRSLDEYFRELGGGRRTLRKAHRCAKTAPDVRWRLLELGEQPPSESLTRAAVSLFARTAERHHHAEPPLALYERVLTRWPVRRLLFVAETPEGALRSALLIIWKGETLYPKFFGTDMGGDYFFLGFSGLLEAAMSRGIRRIECGGGSHQAKLFRGARLRWLLGAFQIYDRQLGTALDALLPHYLASKVGYFSGLAQAWQVDHQAPALPTDLSMAVLGGT